MTHRAYQIVTKIQSLLQARTALGINSSNVYAMRSLTLADDQGELPAATVNYGEDEPAQLSNFDYVWSVLNVHIMTYAQAIDEPALHALLLEHRRQIHIVMHASENLGLPNFVVLVKYAGALAPEIDPKTQMLTGRLQSNWRVTYAMDQSDPGT